VNKGNLWEEWEREQKLKQAEQVVKKMAEIASGEKRKMTDAEKLKAYALNRCSLRRPGSHQSMVEALVNAAKEDQPISERQAWTLRGLYWMYRAQHGDKSAKKPEGWR
jgi:hypothetical protein